MALGALTLPSVSYAFDSEGTAIVPVTAGQGDKKLGTIEIKSPMEDVSEFFAGIDKSLINLVEFAKKSFNLDQKEEQRESLKRQDTDDKIEDVGDNKSMLDSLKESFASLGDAFGQVSIGEKLGAALLVGSLLLFSQVQETLVKILTPVIAVVKKLVDIFGAKGVFLTFLGAIVAIKFAPLITGAIAASKSIAGAFEVDAGVVRKISVAGIVVCVPLSNVSLTIAPEAKGSVPVAPTKFNDASVAVGVVRLSLLVSLTSAKL